MTIMELADRCKVHYNTMRKWLIDNEVPKENEARNSAFLITKQVIEKAEEHFLENQTNEHKKTQKKCERDEDLLSHFVKQLEVKDIQLVNQQAQIDHLQRLLENQQILTLKAQEKVEILENKGADNEEDKKKFWERIFK